MEQQDLPAPERRMIMHQFHQIRLNLDQWMELTAAVLAHTSQAASLVTPPHANQARFKHIELISTHDTLCLMILVLQDGSVHQEMLSVAPELDQDHPEPDLEPVQCAAGAAYRGRYQGDAESRAASA